MAENRRPYGIKPPSKESHKPKPHPFKAASRHERWCLDIRYIEKHRIMRARAPFMSSRSWMPSHEPFSQATSLAILSSDIFQSQDLACVLIVLYPAMEQF